MEKVRYSILIPAYQAASTIERCLDSILKQQGDYEVIVINDGSTDNLDEVLAKYKNKIRLYKQKNKGLAETRNELIKKARGEYILFVDSDDYVKDDYIKVLNCNLAKYKNVDIISFGLELVDEHGNNLSYMSKLETSSIVSGDDLFVSYINNRINFEPTVGYLYNREFFVKNGFIYAKGHNHEDFGLTPLTLVKAKRVVSIKDNLYCYVQTSNSITRGNSKEKIRKNAYDILYHYDNLKSIIDSDNELSKESKRYFYSFLANSVILQLNVLEGNDYKEFKKELQKRNVTKYLFNDTLKRKLKKMFLKLKISI